MKVKPIVFLLILTIFSSQALAKESTATSQLKEIAGSEKKDDREGIHSFDFTKLFSKAEKYYKAAKSWKKIKCTPINGFVCTKHACKKREVKTYIILNKKKDLLTRCEKENCESFDADFEQTGVFYNIQSKGPIGTLIRILGDSRYKEITTVGLDAYIANGNCTIVTD